MIAEQLKKSILQAAIQGKLTQQLPEDGDARDLLKEIKKEKVRLIKEGKIKKEKPLPEITEDEIPFEIPENWCWVRLGKIVLQNLGGGTPSKSNPDYWNGGIPWASVKDLNCKFLDSTQDSISEDGLINSSSNLIPAGNLIACTRMGLGKVVYNRIDVAINQDLRAIFLPENISKWYVYYFYLTLNFTGKGATVKGISVESLSNTLLPLPPIKEQKRIVERIEELLPEIESLKNDENKLEELQKSFPKKMKDAILQYAIQGKLTQQLPEDGDARDLLKEIKKEKARLIKEGKIKKEKPLPEITEDEIPFETPENWCWVRLGEITDYGVGKQVSAEKIQPNSWILELEDIEKETFKLTCKRFDREPGSSKNAFSKGCVLYGKLRPYLKKVIIADESGYCSTEIIPFNGYGNINSSYLKYCMVAPSIDSNINQITHGMDMPRLGTDKAKLLCIPLPPLAEQKRIVDCLEGILPFCEGLQ